jgi:tRNA pseudouridine38-40 synthase
VQNPLKRLYSYHVLHRINETLLKEASLLFLGTHDFTSFANKAHQGCAAKNAVRTIFRLDVIPETGGLRLEFEGDGFLYKMVRNITGTLLDVACGKIPFEHIHLVFKRKDRCLAGRIAPACGLFLKKISYNPSSRKKGFDF